MKGHGYGILHTVLPGCWASSVIQLSYQNMMFRRLDLFLSSSEELGPDKNLFSKDWKPFVSKVILHTHRGCSTVLFSFGRAYSCSLQSNPTYFIPVATGFVCFSFLDIVWLNTLWLLWSRPTFTRMTNGTSWEFITIINSVCLSTAPTPIIGPSLSNRKQIQCDSFGTRPKEMRIYQRLFIRFWTCIYDYIPCFMRSMSILVCRSLTFWRHRDNDWRLAPCRAQPCHCVVR